MHELRGKRWLSVSAPNIPNVCLINFSFRISSDFQYSYNIDDNLTFPLKASLRDDQGMNLKLNTSFDFTKNPDWQTNTPLTCLGKSFFSVHPSNELPLNVDMEFLDRLSFYDVLIIPDVTKADKSLKLLDIEFRKCYFDDERMLTIFKIYTQKNCELECVSHAGKLEIYESCFGLTLVVVLSGCRYLSAVLDELLKIPFLLT